MSEENSKLQVILTEQGLEKSDVAKMVEAFGGPFEEAGDILAAFEKDAEGNLVPGKDAIKVKDENDFASMAEAREQRLALKKARTTVENKRKELKADIVKQGRAIDSVAKYVKEEIEPAEKYLEEQEKFAELRAAEKAAKLKAERVEKLMAYTDDISVYNLDEMSDDQFNSLLATLKAQKEAEDKRIADEAKAKAEAEAAEKKRQEEQAAENERLKKEAKAKEEADARKIARINQVAALGLVWNEAAESYVKDDFNVSKVEILSLSDEEFIKVIDAIKTEMESRAETARKEQEAKDAEEKKKRDAEEAERQKDREKAEKLEAEKRDRETAEAKKKEEAEAAERAALLSPDKDKLLALADSVQKIELPALKSKEAQAILDKTEELLEKVATYIRGNVKGL